MNDDPDMLDALLRDHLRGELDSQLGRAEAGFARELSRRRNSSPRRTGRLLIGGLWAAGLMAASVGIVWGVAVHHAAQRPQIAPRHEARADPPALTMPRQAEIPLEQIVTYRTLDEGAVVLENHGPARQLRRQVLQTVQWYDQQRKASLEITVPREQIVFVGMPSY